MSECLATIGILCQFAPMRTIDRRRIRTGLNNARKKRSQTPEGRHSDGQPLRLWGYAGMAVAMTVQVTKKTFDLRIANRSNDFAGRDRCV
jgi:hypothetical protein